MPNLISDDKYKETIRFIEKKEKPSELLEEMIDFYSSKKIKLYNISVNPSFTDKDKYEVTIYTDVLEEAWWKNKIKKQIATDAMIFFKKLCKKYNLWQNKPMEGELITGYYFPRIWKDGVIESLGKTLCYKIEKIFKDDGVCLVVNSGLGVYTVFYEADKYENREASTQKIKDFVVSEIKSYDTHNVVDNPEKVIEFDTIEELNKLNGNLYFYYK